MYKVPKLFQIDPTAYQSIYSGLTKSLIRSWFQALNTYTEVESVDYVPTIEQFLKDQLGADNLVRDLYFTLYSKYGFEHKDMLASSQLPTKGIIEGITQSPDYDTLRYITVGNKFESMLATMRTLLAIMNNLPEEAKEAGKDLAQAEKDVANKAAQLEESMSEDGEGDTTEATQELEDANDALEAATQAYEDMQANSEATLQTSMGKATQEATEKTEDTIAFVKAFTKAAGGEVNQALDLEAIRPAMEALKNFKNFKDFADVLGWGGRFTEGIKRQSNRKKATPSSIKGMDFNPSRVLQIELMRLNGVYGQSEKFLATQRLLEGGLLHRDTEDAEAPEGKGDIIMLQDESGSMSEAEVMTLKSIAWGLIEQIKPEGRSMATVQFSGWGQYSVWTSPGQTDTPDYEGLAETMKRKYHGGTEPFKPLEAALEMIEKGDMKKADIILCTDGAFSFPTQPFLDYVSRIKAEYGTRIFVVNTAGLDNENAESFADINLTVADLHAERNMLQEILSQVL